MANEMIAAVVKWVWVHSLDRLLKDRRVSPIVERCMVRFHLSPILYDKTMHILEKSLLTEVKFNYLSNQQRKS